MWIGGGVGVVGVGGRVDELINKKLACSEQKCNFIHSKYSPFEFSQPSISIASKRVVKIKKDAIFTVNNKYSI